MLKGKQGRFRQNLLGKRVDYSGRSVIVVGPNLKMHQCGLPKEMALELFKPFVMKKLVDRNIASNIKSAKKMMERGKDEVWDILETVIQEHPVLLNRAPTLHRLGIQAFEPVLVEGRALQIHPLVCTAYNADFDGDQMAVHVPLSAEAQAEARLLMLSTGNILNPKDGRPVVTPTQDMVIGCYYLTLMKEGEKGENRAFSSPEEARMALENEEITLHARIKVKINNEIVETTVGRIIFNEALPSTFPVYNQVISKKELGEIVYKCYQEYGNKATAETLDAIKSLGFYYATQGGITVGLTDFETPRAKYEILKAADEKVDEIEKDYQMD